MTHSAFLQGSISMVCTNLGYEDDNQQESDGTPCQSTNNSKGDLWCVTQNKWQWCTDNAECDHTVHGDTSTEDVIEG